MYFGSFYLNYEDAVRSFKSLEVSAIVSFRLRDAE